MLAQLKPKTNAILIIQTDQSIRRNCSSQNKSVLCTGSQFSKQVLQYGRIIPPYARTHFSLMGQLRPIYVTMQELGFALLGICRRFRPGDRDYRNHA